MASRQRPRPPPHTCFPRRVLGRAERRQWLHSTALTAPPRTRAVDLTRPHDRQLADWMLSAAPTVGARTPPRARERAAHQHVLPVRNCFFTACPTRCLSSSSLGLTKQRPQLAATAFHCALGSGGLAGGTFFGAILKVRPACRRRRCVRGRGTLGRGAAALRSAMRAPRPAQCGASSARAARTSRLGRCRWAATRRSCACWPSCAAHGARCRIRSVHASSARVRRRCSSAPHPRSPSVPSSSGPQLVRAAAGAGRISSARRLIRVARREARRRTG